MTAILVIGIGLFINGLVLENTRNVFLKFCCSISIVLLYILLYEVIHGK